MQIQALDRHSAQLVSLVLAIDPQFRDLGIRADPQLRDLGIRADPQLRDLGIGADRVLVAADTNPDRVLRDYLELAADMFAVELEGRLIFAF